MLGKINFLKMLSNDKEGGRFLIVFVRVLELRMCILFLVKGHIHLFSDEGIVNCQETMMALHSHELATSSKLKKEKGCQVLPFYLLCTGRLGVVVSTDSSPSFTTQ